MNPRRILIFSLSYFPRFVGGAEVAIKEITDRIAWSDLEFDMITLGDGVSPTMESLGSIRLHRIFKSSGWLQKLLFPFAAFFKAQRLHAIEPYDAIWAIMASYAGFGAFLFKKRNPKIPLVLNIQEGDNFERRQGPFRPLFVKIFRSADYIHAISNYLERWARDMGAKCPIVVVPNGVDFKAFSKEVLEADKEFINNKLCRKEGDVFLITTGRLVAKNAVGDIIDSLQYLPKNVKLLVLGKGYLEGDLKQQTLRLGLNYTDEPPMNPGNRVHFVGFVSHADLPAYLAVSDVFIRPAISEGLGNSFLEAMAAGLPVVATPVGGIPDFLTEGETGLFCEVKNPKSIAQKVEKCLKDVESRDYIVKKAKAQVKDKYQWEKIADDVRKIFFSFKQ
ncbi:MAG: glycosyltransferase family 4 protein [Candidatus Taylorbacteria bacterium]|nr:glycosyltransferase family 4 protein [Candidatus Taylorbacteria bacterium]